MGRKKSNNNEKRNLVLIDHDGTLCDTNPNAYESIKFAFRFAIERLKLDIKDDWDIDKMCSATTGSTEKNLIRHFCYFYGVPYSLTEDFESNVYYGRAKWYENMKNCGEYVWDTYYPDAHQMIEMCSERDNYSCWLVTGNPRNVASIRISNSIKKLFTFPDNSLKGAFGDEAFTREELIEKAIKYAVDDAKKNWDGFSVVRDEMGFAKNVFYFGDSRSDFFGGIKAKVNVVWIPSRTLQVVKKTCEDDAIKYIKSILGDRILITNDLFSAPVLKMLKL